MGAPSHTFPIFSAPRGGQSAQKSHCAERDVTRLSLCSSDGDARTSAPAALAWEVGARWRASRPSPPGYATQRLRRIVLLTGSGLRARESDSRRGVVLRVSGEVASISPGEATLHKSYGMHLPSRRAQRPDFSLR